MVGNCRPSWFSGGSLRLLFRDYVGMYEGLLSFSAGFHSMTPV